MTKLHENVFRSVNIAFVNELAQLCDRMGISVWEVIDAASTKPYGFTRFDPGPGMGGHCLPIDPFYLAYKARDHDFYTEFIELAGKLNQSQPLFCVRKAERTLNDVGKSGARRADPDPRRLLQGERRRHPRVAGAEDHRRPARARRRGHLPRPARRRAARPRPRVVRPLGRGAAARPGGDRHRSRRRRPRPPGARGAGGARPARRHPPPRRAEHRPPRREARPLAALAPTAARASRSSRSSSPGHSRPRPGSPGRRSRPGSSGAARPR